MIQCKCGHYYSEHETQDTRIVCVKCVEDAKTVRTPWNPIHQYRPAY